MVNGDQMQKSKLNVCVVATAGNNMFALWPGERLNFSIFKSTTFGFVGQHAASEAGHIANTNVGGNFFGQHGHI